MKATTTNMIDRTNTSRNPLISTNIWPCEAPAFNDDYGILVGIGPRIISTLAPDLSTPLLNADIQYYDTNVEQVHMLDPSSYFPINRTIRNYSVDPIALTEMGLFTTWGGWFFMMVYDYFPEPIVINPSIVITANYWLATAYPQS